MYRGRVRWFSNSYGFGFIQDEEGNDVFVHYSVIRANGYRSLSCDQEVVYEKEASPKGERATLVLLVQSPVSDDQQPAA